MDIFKNRLKKLKVIMNNAGYNAFYISNITNVRYLSGFTGSSGFLLITDNGDYFFSDGRYTEQSKNEIFDYEIHITNNHLKEIVDNNLLNSSWNLCFESSHLSFNMYSTLSTKCDVKELVPTNIIK